MFAVVKTGGKQYVVQKGAVFNIEKIEGQEGDKIRFDKILLIADDKGEVEIGTPYIKGAEVEGEIKKQFKGKKIEIIKFKRKTGYRKKRGHRQNYTKVEIKTIKKEK